jgi:hypothetical protein
VELLRVQGSTRISGRPLVSALACGSSAVIEPLC